ncbi:unnamed protein product [Cladocopium goreaui]|uniref:Carnosine N-methyltransferase n=1 Tax=Cladocopium goreaui TaxID=2562237 RepID=A0A9P1C0K2_9DINO|nr:unnamed protein product [Cladocopium goreaui]
MCCCPPTAMAVPFPNFGSYEWLLPFADVKHVFQDLPLRTEGTVLTVVVGCGTSDLSRELHTHLGLPQVVSIDNDEEVVSHMKAQHEDLKAALSFHQADLTAPCSHVVADGAADLVVDKSTLDCLLCSEGAPKLVHNIYRMLRVGGCYVVISFHQKEFLMSLLSLAFSIESAIDLQRDVGPDVLALVLRKGTEELPELQKALDAWNVQMPKDLMSETRREALEADWLQRLRPGASALPLSEAYEVMISSSEKREYSLSDFEQDVADHGGTAGTTELTLQEALHFLEQMQ